MSRTEITVWSQRNKNIWKYVVDCLYAVCSVHFWITAEGKTKCIHLESTHSIVEVVHQNDCFSNRHPDTRRARVYYCWTWPNAIACCHVMWSKVEPAQNSNALRGHVILLTACLNGNSYVLVSVSFANNNEIIPGNMMLTYCVGTGCGSVFWIQ